MRLLSKLRFRGARIVPAGRPVAEGINNRTQKSPVNPLTRLASRSVMQVLFSRRMLRGLPRPSIHRLTGRCATAMTAGACGED